MPVLGDIYDIEARVREIDPRLLLIFDPLQERYVVFEKIRTQREEAVMSDGTPVYALVDELMHVTTLEEADGSFRPLDERLLDDLIRMDTQRDAKWFDKFKENAKRQRERRKASAYEDLTYGAKRIARNVREEIRYGKELKLG